ncbi:MAG: LysR family transcriptional regulator, partial [Deltaproteobacteria bacterium]|nr:LysR family transcriptional regulator [Deltaproteobacteria bacterium]
MIELQLLKQLVTFRQYGTLSAASEVLHLSQPSLTRSMQKLESLLGVPLFERDRNRIRLNA